MSELAHYQQPDLASFYLTSLSSNTPETVAYEIRKAYAEHPVTGLHQAELYIYGRAQALRLAVDSIDRDRRKLTALNRDFDRLLKYQRYKLDGLYYLFARKYLDLEVADLQSKIQAGIMAVAEAMPMVEDAQAELDAAIAERASIFEASPWLAESSKSQITALCDRPRLEAKLQRIAAEGARIEPSADRVPLSNWQLQQLEQVAHLVTASE